MPAVAQRIVRSWNRLWRVRGIRRAAAESDTDRWIRPTLRMIAGRARRVMAPASALPRRAAGSGAAPARASARGTIASRAAVCTAICGVTPTAASACSRRMRVEVPGEPTTTGVGANLAPSPRACPRRGGSWGSTNRSYCSPSGWTVSRSPGSGKCAPRQARTRRRGPALVLRQRRRVPGPGLRLRGGRSRSRQQTSPSVRRRAPGWRCLPAGV